MHFDLIIRNLPKIVDGKMYLSGYCILQVQWNVYGNPHRRDHNSLSRHTDGYHKNVDDRST